MDASLARAREILALVKAEERRRVDENGGRRLPPLWWRKTTLQKPVPESESR